MDFIETLLQQSDEQQLTWLDEKCSDSLPEDTYNVNFASQSNSPQGFCSSMLDDNENNNQLQTQPHSKENDKDVNTKKKRFVHM